MKTSESAITLVVGEREAEREDKVIAEGEMEGEQVLQYPVQKRDGL